MLVINLPTQVNKKYVFLVLHLKHKMEDVIESIWHIYDCLVYGQIIHATNLIFCSSEAYVSLMDGYHSSFRATTSFRAPHFVAQMDGYHSSFLEVILALCVMMS